MGRNKSTVLVGSIGGAYGIKGWVHVHSFTDPVGNIFEYSPWRLSAAADESQVRSAEIAESRAHGKGLVVRFEGVADRDAAELLKGLEIRVARDLLPAPGSGQFYWADLEGLRVEDRGGKVLGRVEQLLDTGSADVMVVVGDGRHLIPFVYGETVVAVDLDNAFILVDWDTGEDV